MKLFVYICTQIVQVFDTYAGELGPALFNKYELPMLKAIAAEVRQQLVHRQIELVPMVSQYFKNNKDYVLCK